LGGVPVSRLLPDRQDLTHMMLVTATECTTDEDMTALVSALKEVL